MIQSSELDFCGTGMNKRMLREVEHETIEKPSKTFESLCELRNSEIVQMMIKLNE